MNVIPVANQVRLTTIRVHGNQVSFLFVCGNRPAVGTGGLLWNERDSRGYSNFREDKPAFVGDWRVNHSGNLKAELSR